MPFSAEAKNGNGIWERVDITTLDAPKIELVNHELRCPDADCHAELVIRHGAIVAPHFAHRANQATRACIFAGNGGESQDHLTAKQTIIERLRNSRLYRGAMIEPERILRDGSLKRIADVYVEFPDGSTEVHEAQLAKTTIEECQQRTRDYHALGVGNVVWWFGRANRNDTILHQWAVSECSLVGTLDFTMQRITIND